jgi:hypothetical protein
MSAETAIEPSVAERADIVGGDETQEHEACLLAVEAVHVLQIRTGPEPAHAGKRRDRAHTHDQEQP